MPRFRHIVPTLKGCLVGTADHFASQKRQPFLRRHYACSFHSDRAPQGSNRKPPVIGKRKDHPHGWSFLLLVAEVGFEPHGLRVMSPTSYQAALLRDMNGAGERGRTVTEITLHGILSPGCLPIPPLRRTGRGRPASLALIVYHKLMALSTPFSQKLVDKKRPQSYTWNISIISFVKRRCHRDSGSVPFPYAPNAGA